MILKANSARIQSASAATQKLYRYTQKIKGLEGRGERQRGRDRGVMGTAGSGKGVWSANGRTPPLTDN